MSTTTALVCAIPWIATPVVTAIRMRQSKSLDDVAEIAPDAAPALSIIVPARNEAHNIGACLDALRASRYARLEIIVVDDASTDGTGDIAREIAADDARIRVMSNTPLPDGWFGKQWACWNGAHASHGDVLAFLDADTRVAPDLFARTLTAMTDSRSDLFSVLGAQDMVTFWERMIQPQILSMLAIRFGGSEAVNDSKHAWNKIANGQCLLMRRDAYERIDGHRGVRGYVAEDLMLAQRAFAVGLRTRIILGRSQIRTRMYTSLADLIGGWRKNVFAGGRHSLPPSRILRALMPVFVPLPALMQLAPLVALLLVLVGIGGHSVTLWATIAVVVQLVWWIVLYLANDQPVRYALLYPLGAAVTGYILVTAVARGSRVEWKGREYTSVLSHDDEPDDANTTGALAQQDPISS